MNEVRTFLLLDMTSNLEINIPTFHTVVDASWISFFFLGPKVFLASDAKDS